jgi:hypothetical protein
MALQLTLDGKPIGNVSDKGDLVDGDGKVVKDITPGAEREKITLVDPGAPVPPTDEPTGDEPTGDEPTGDEPPADEVLKLKNEVDTLNRIVQSLSRQPASPQQQQQVQEVKKLIDDHIPDNLDKEKDPFGLAITMKGIVKALNNMQGQVERLDQNAGFQEGMRQLEGEKGNYEVFKDKKLGPLAEQVLQVELHNSPDPLPLIVKRVADKFEGVGTSGGKEYVKKKADQLKKVPGTLQRKDGATTAITIDKPKNVAESKKAYQAWRNARAKGGGK